MSQVHTKGAVTPRMNITPLIDVVFLLIIFFMLVSKIVAEEAEPMIVPVLTDPKTVQLGEIDRIVINVVPIPFKATDRENWDSDTRPALAIPAYIKVGLTQFTNDPDGLKQAAETLKAAVERGPKDAEGNSTLEVLLRADSAIVYSHVEPVMAMITSAGIAKVNLVAYSPDE